MNENGNVDSYDITVKYNTNIDTSKVFLGTYDEFIVKYADAGIDLNGDLISRDRFDTRNSLGRKVLGTYDGGKPLTNVCIINYSGYLKFKTEKESMVLEAIYIDNKPLQIKHFEPNGVDLKYYEFEGYISDRVEIHPDDQSISLTFEEFSTIPYNLSLSEDVFKTYEFEDKDNYTNTEWGELVITETYQPTLKFNWYNPNNDIPTEQLEANYPHYNTPQGVIGPNMRFISGNENTIFDTYWGAAIGFWEYLTLNNGELFESTKTPSGWKDLGYNGEGLTTFPILIHKNDIGKQNTIGPLVRQDGTEIYINLTII